MSAWRLYRELLKKAVWLFISILFLFQIASFAQPFNDISLQSRLSEAWDNSAVAVADYDGDHDLDVFLVQRWDHGSGQAVSSQLFRNNNDGSFSDVTYESGIHSTHDYSSLGTPGTHEFGHKMAASWGDYDNDGYPDLFLTSALFYELYHNNGDGTFSNVTVEAGFDETNFCYNTGALWFDYNNDSYLDLYLTVVFGCPAKLYRNNADGTFTNVTASSGLSGSGIASWMAIPWDINKDGYQDLYISIDFDQANQFYINQSGYFYNDTAAALGLEDREKDGMGLALSDYNNDTYTDLFITNINESSLYRYPGTDTFENVAARLNVEETGWSWGCQFADFDHDLDEDLVVLNGYYNDTDDRFYENLLEEGSEAFLNRSAAYGMDQASKSNGLAVFDYDNDGDLDMLYGRTLDHPNFLENQLLENNSEGNNNWVQIELEGTLSNRDAVGSLVRLRAGNLVLTRHKHGAVLFAQNQQPLHFGLAGISEIEELIITWPSGLVEQYDSLPVNSFFHFTEGNSYEILELGATKIPGCTDPLSCNYDPGATFDDGSCNIPDDEEILGVSVAGILSEQQYTFSPVNDGLSYHWEVENGEIIGGQGEATIAVRWEVANEGSVSCVEFGDCYGARVEKQVYLSTEGMPEDISVARMWNEVLLAAIRNDYARPTVHARNLFHASIAMYDAWASFNEEAEPYLLGKRLHSYWNDFQGFELKGDKQEAMEEAISYAVYRLMKHRFKDSPQGEDTREKMDALMQILDFDPGYTSTDYSGGNPAALGNYIGQSLIEYGLIDGSNEYSKYDNYYYQPVNAPLAPDLPGNHDISDPNRWQPLQLQVFIDQAGNLITGNTPDFLSPEWGNVYAFSLDEGQLNTYTRDGDDYRVYLDPGPPPAINQRKLSSGSMDLYKWNFALVAIWSSHLDPFDEVMWNISPGNLGNIAFDSLPRRKEDHESFYDLLDGGDIGQGRATNPVTGEAYEDQWVPRGDYARVLAEFWADGPDSETPPGHWFVLLNYVQDHEAFKRIFKGEGSELEPLEWDVKAYFILGGTMHDAAIAAWAVKGWYDYIRPISAIRYMADQGQCSDTSQSNFSSSGIPLIPGYIEIVEEGDELAGTKDEHLGKIKIFGWKGHDYVEDTEVDQAGVGWILAENWWPYQRPSFVTPPFAGYVSGHSTYSRAAAEALTLLTGSEYFPGGMGEFAALKNEFLVFEEGPSQDVILQWATYRDASDQCSLSRIWGGIHPPADDIPGRIMGAQIGKQAFAYAEKYFSKELHAEDINHQDSYVYPVPAREGHIYVTGTHPGQAFKLYDLRGAEIALQGVEQSNQGISRITLKAMEAGVYILRSGKQSWKVVVE